jgi:TRAP-type C4-dicarboxylate transport system permease small subunit
MTNCPECETSLKAGKKFCTACGAALAAPPPRHWLRIVLPAALLIFAVIVFSVAWTVFTTDGFFDFRDDEILVAWGLTILGLAAAAGAVLILRRGRSRRP